MNSHRIIIVDDEPCIRDSIAMYLEGLGFEVIAAEDPTVCEALAHDHTCVREEACGDIILVDQHMPHMTGVEFIERRVKRGCKAILKQTAVMSGSLSESDREKLDGLGCHYFEKPVALATIKAWIEKVLLNENPCLQ
jgi:CheY-like chemotaxis protein